jgi:hypothetical protein
MVPGLAKRFEYTLAGGARADGADVSTLATRAFRVATDAPVSARGVIVVELEIDLAAAMDDVLLRVDDGSPLDSGWASTHVLELRNAIDSDGVKTTSVFVRGVRCSGGVPYGRSLVLSGAGASAALAVRTPSGVAFDDVAAPISTGGTRWVDVTVASSVTKVAFWTAEAKPTWAGWWVRVPGPAASIPRLTRRFEYAPGSFWADSTDVRVDTLGRTFVIAAPAPLAQTGVFVMSVEVADPAHGDMISLVEEDGRSLSLTSLTSLASLTSPTGLALAVFSGVGDRQQRSTGTALARVASAVLSSDGSAATLAVRAGPGAAKFDAVATGVQLLAGGTKQVTVTVAACVSKATFWWGYAPPRGVDWAGWWSRVPVLSRSVGVARWDAAFNGARYAAVCAESGAQPWSANYARRQIDAVRATGMAAGGDGYIVWDGSALAAVESPRGPTGAKGLVGGVGEKGATGPPSTVVGPTGETGDTGATGPKGATGDKGMDGDRGVHGDAGADGPAGAVGAAGAAGAKGSTGDAGPTGPQSGPPGDPGSQGDAGAVGATGAKGATGPQGKQGPLGANASAGSRGAAGAQGSQGASGPPGAQGLAGAKGATGPDGATGPPGDSTWTGRYSPVARMPACNVAGSSAPGSVTATFDFPSVPLAARRLTVTVGVGSTLVLAAMRPYDATVGNYSDAINNASPSFLDATGLVLTYALDSPVPVCGYELSASGTLRRWTLELDGVMCDSRTEEDYALSSVAFVRIPIEPRSATVAKLTILSCSPSAGVRLLLNHTGPP